MLEPTDTGLRKLFQAAGHHRPGTDLTARIMARVAVTPMARPAPIKPLIGQWGWGAMAAGVIALFALVLIGNGSTTTTTPTLLTPFIEMTRNIRVPQGDWTVWASGVSACALLFTLLDRVLARRVALREGRA